MLRAMKLVMAADIGVREVCRRRRFCAGPITETTWCPKKLKVYKTRDLPKSSRGKSAERRGIADSDFVSESRLAIRGVSLSQQGLFEAE